MPVHMWIARNKLDLSPPAGPHQYSVSTDQPSSQVLGDAVVWEVPDPETQHWINAELWHRVGGVRLAPGAGPVLVVFSVTCQGAVSPPAAPA